MSFLRIFALGTPGSVEVNQSERDLFPIGALNAIEAYAVPVDLVTLHQLVTAVLQKEFRRLLRP